MTAVYKKNKKQATSNNTRKHVRNHEDLAF